MIKLLRMLIIVSFCVLVSKGNVFAAVLWSQSFETQPIWSSESDNSGTLPSTHSQALQLFNASAFRVSGQGCRVYALGRQRLLNWTLPTLM